MNNMRPVLNIKELANYLRVHQSTIYRLVRRGDLPAFKIGSDWRFNIEAIDNWRLGRTLETEAKFPATKVRAA